MYSTIAEMTNQSSAPKLFTTQVRMARRAERMTKASTVMVTTVAAKRVPLADAAMADYVELGVEWTLERPEGTRGGEEEGEDGYYQQLT